MFTIGSWHHPVTHCGPKEVGISGYVDCFARSNILARNRLVVPGRSVAVSFRLQRQRRLFHVPCRRANRGVEQTNANGLPVSVEVSCSRASVTRTKQSRFKSDTSCCFFAFLPTKTTKKQLEVSDLYRDYKYWYSGLLSDGENAYNSAR